MRSRSWEGSDWALSPKAALRRGTERKNPREEPEPGQGAGEGVAGSRGQAWAERQGWGGEEVKVWVQTTCMGVEQAAPRVNERVAEGRGGDSGIWEISHSGRSAEV